MGLRLHTSIAIAVVAHASLLLLPSWQDKKTLAVPIAKDVAEPAPPEEPLPQVPLAIEFITLPSTTPGNKSKPDKAHPRARRFTAQTPSHKELATTPPPTKTSEFLRATSGRDPAPSDNTILGPDKAPATAKGGYSLGMRRRSGPLLSGRQGSLIDDAIAAAPLPPGNIGSRSDLIQTEARIGLDSQATRTTGWRDSGGGTKTSVGEPFTAHIARDGKITFQDRPPIEAEVVRWGRIPMPMVAGKFDLTDAAMATFGEVLYPYRKLKAMDQTREHRAAMAVRARGESLQKALRRFDRDLKKIWRDESLSRAQRRAIIFALWDECAEVGPQDVLRTAASVRGMIVAFVLRELPQAGSVGFSTEELSALNEGRQSSQEFRPYQ